MFANSSSATGYSSNPVAPKKSLLTKTSTVQNFLPLENRTQAVWLTIILFNTTLQSVFNCIGERSAVRSSPCQHSPKHRMADFPRLGVRLRGGAGSAIALECATRSTEAAIAKILLNCHYLELNASFATSSSLSWRGDLQNSFESTLDVMDQNVDSL